MNLYLVRHGQAKSKEEDPDRPLTDAGRNEVSQIGEALAAAGATPARVVHSPKTRAQQTAELLAGALGVNGAVQPDDDLKALAEPAAWAGRIDDADDDLMLVGHLPHVGRLAGLLLIGEPDADIFDFDAGATLCLASDGEGGWQVKWMLSPTVA